MQVPCCNDNIHGFPHHLAPSAFTFIKLLRERETCFHQKFLVCPEVCMTQKTLVLGQMISLVIPGENQLRNKPEDYGFISLYSSLSEEALLIFVMFLPFQVDAKRVIFHIILVIIVICLITTIKTEKYLSYGKLSSVTYLLSIYTLSNAQENQNVKLISIKEKEKPPGGQKT